MSLFYLSILVAVFGCHKKEENPSKSSEALRLCFKEKITSLDPRVGVTRPSSIVVKMLFEGLMRQDQEGNLIPGLAERYEISEDQKTYTFYLRSCRWSNGDPVTAYDFEFAWKRSITPKLAQASSYAYYPIKNASKCLEGKLSLDSVGINALSNRVLTVELEHPAPYFLELISTSLFAPIPKKNAIKNEDWANQKGYNFVCNGPFRLRKWEKSKTLAVERNPLYWNAAEVRLTDIRIKIHPNENTQLDLYAKKKIDWVGHPLGSISSETIEKMGAVENQSALGLLAYFCNVTRYPLNNKNLRKALAYAINRKEIAKYLLCEGCEPAQALLHPLLRKQRSKEYFRDNDAVKATLYLNMALNELGISIEQLPHIVLSYPNTCLQSRVAQVVQRQWKETLGILVTLDPFDKPRFFDKISRGNHQIASCMWKGFLCNPIYTLECFGSMVGENIATGWKEPEFMQLIYKLRSEKDGDKVQALIEQAESYLLEEMPIIPICFGSMYYSKTGRLKNVYISPQFGVDFTNAYLQDGVRRSENP